MTWTSPEAVAIIVSFPRMKMRRFMKFDCALRFSAMLPKEFHSQTPIICECIVHEAGSAGAGHQSSQNIYFLWTHYGIYVLPVVYLVPCGPE